MKIKELQIDECWKILENAKKGKIACVWGNQPHIFPFKFAYGGESFLYAFSTVGPKIRWMRANPLVCVEIEEAENQEERTTLHLYGSYEELPDEPDFEKQRIYAHELLSSSPMWWRSVEAAGTHLEEIEEKPVYFRIYIEKITGCRAVKEDFEAVIPLSQETMGRKNGWFSLW